MDEMSTKKMPGPDEALKNFFENNEVFADVFNSYLFKDDVIDPSELQPAKRQTFHFNIVTLVFLIALSFREVVTVQNHSIFQLFHSNSKALRTNFRS